MRLIVLYAFYLSSVSFVYAQKNAEAKNSYNLSFNFGMGLSKFAISGFDTEDYPAMVTRLGVGISKTVINRFQVESGISIYFRAKSKSPLKDRIYWYGKGAPLPRLDETAIERHFAFEIPISIRYLINEGRSMYAGVMVRQWRPNDQVDILASQTEFGCILGVNQRILTDLTIGLEFYLGFTDFYHGSTIGSSGGIVIKNRAALISLSYAL